MKDFSKLYVMERKNRIGGEDSHGWFFERG